MHWYVENGYKYVHKKSPIKSISMYKRNWANISAIIDMLTRTSLIVSQVEESLKIHLGNHRETSVRKTKERKMHYGTRSKSWDNQRGRVVWDWEREERQTMEALAVRRRAGWGRIVGHHRMVAPMAEASWAAVWLHRLRERSMGGPNWRTGVDRFGNIVLSPWRFER